MNSRDDRVPNSRGAGSSGQRSRVPVPVEHGAPGMPEQRCRRSGSAEFPESRDAVELSSRDSRVRSCRDDAGMWQSGIPGCAGSAGPRRPAAHGGAVPAVSRAGLQHRGSHGSGVCVPARCWQHRLPPGPAASSRPRRPPPGGAAAVPTRPGPPRVPPPPREEGAPGAPRGHRRGWSHGAPQTLFPP